MRDAVAALVRDGDTVVIEGFTHLICFAAGHEIIRQRRRDLTLCRLTPDLIYDQMIAAGCARKLVFSWAGNPGAGSLHAFRRAVEKGDPPLELEEYSHFGMVARLSAGAARLPFWTLRDYMGTDLPVANPRIRSVTCPYTGEVLATVPALNPDVTIVHAQRADAQGNTQIWGLLGVQKEAAFASRAGDRGGRGAGGRVGDPRRPQPHAHPGPRGGRGGGGAVGRPPVVRAGLLRPRQRLLRRLGADLPRPGRRCSATSTSSSTACATGRSTWSAAAGWSGSGRRAGCVPG